jgi:hypothetical protein
MTFRELIQDSAPRHPGNPPRGLGRALFEDGTEASKEGLVEDGVVRAGFEAWPTIRFQKTLASS